MAEGADDRTRKRIEQPSHVKVVDSYTRPTGGEAPPETRWRGRLRGGGTGQPTTPPPPGPRAHIDVPDDRPVIVISEPGIDEEIAALEAAEAARRAEEEAARRAEEEAARRAEEEAARRAEEEARAALVGQEVASAEAPSDQPAGSEAVAWTGTTVHIDDLDGEEVADEIAEERTGGRQGAAAAAGGDGPRRRPSARVRRRRVAAAAVGLAVVGGGGAGAVIALHPGRGAPAARSSQPPSTSPSTTSVRPQPPASSTTTTAAGPLPPSSSDPTGAVWVTPAGTYTVTLNAHGACWVEVAAGPGGAVLSEETLAAGDVRTVSRPGPLWIRLGAAAEVTVTLDGRPLALPGAVGDNPYNVTLQAPA